MDVRVVKVKDYNQWACMFRRYYPNGKSLPMVMLVGIEEDGAVTCRQMSLLKANRSEIAELLERSAMASIIGREKIRRDDALLAPLLDGAL